MTRNLAHLSLALVGANAMALPRLQPPVPAPSSLSPTLPKTIKVPPGSPSFSSSGAQIPSAASIAAPSAMEAKTPKVPADAEKVPPPAQIPPGKDPKPSVAQGGGDAASGTNGMDTAAPTFVLNDEGAANEGEETLLESTTESGPTIAQGVSMAPTFLPTDYASGLQSESPAFSYSFPTFAPTMSTKELFASFPTMVPTNGVVLASDVDVSPIEQAVSNATSVNDTHSDIYLSDASTHYTVVPVEMSRSSSGSNAQPQSSDAILQYGLISISLGFILSSVAMMGVIRRRAMAHRKSEELPTTLADGSVL